MQDRFKFRAWLKNENRYGYLLNLFNCGSNSQYEVEEYDEQGNHYTVYSADEVILQQYTGLKDKNGKLIFEGDIVFYPDEYCRRNKYEIYLEIVWKEGEYSAQGFFTTKSSNLQFRDYHLVDFTREDGLMDVEIIGNIYENPELLEVK